MKTFSFILILSTFCSLAFAQSLDQGQLYAGPSDHLIDIEFKPNATSPFERIDDFVVNTDPTNFASSQNLAVFLSKQFDSDHELVRSIYTWIALNISYDHKLLYTNEKKDQCSIEVWKSRSAVCEGYANLFQDMCTSAGIESRIIKGYVKDFTGNNDIQFPNHAWNSVKIDGKWHILDVTWASVNNEVNQLNTQAKNNYSRQKLDYFFLMDPKKMIFTHLPEDPYWQLQDNFIHLETFSLGKDYILAALNNPVSKENNFSLLIEQYEKLDSLDRSISLLERMEHTKWNKAKEYGLGIAYYYKAQKIIKDSQQNADDPLVAKKLAWSYYKKSLDQLTQINEDDFGFEFSRDLADNVAFRMEIIQ